MVMDYSGRRPVAKNRPRKQPVGIFAVILVSAVSMSFALGVLTGWFVFRQERQAVTNQQAIAVGANGASGAATQVQYPNPEAGASGVANPPLTFYETLPKGSKAIIGSGLNPVKPDQPQPLKPAVQPPAPSQQPAAQQPPDPVAAKGEEKKEQEKKVEQPAHAAAADPAGASKQPAVAGKFCVQIASTQDRKEAEALKGKLAEKGFPVYIVESNIKDKGTWFRVRAGKHLSQQSAGDLAAKAGRGAIVIPE